MSVDRRRAFAHRYGPWALVTGAAKGLGAEFAQQLAASGLNVVLVDVDAIGLAAVADDLQARYQCQTHTIAVDLTQPDFIASITAVTDALDIGLVINNAGISAVGLFLQRPLADHLQVMALNVRAPLIIAHHFAAGLVARQRGGMIFVSSLSALQGTACFAHYAGTKAWNLMLAESLWEELGVHGVDVLGYLVGSTRTPGFAQSAPQLERVGFIPIMSAQATVCEALMALGQRPSRIAGRMNRLLSGALVRLLPRAWAVRLVSRTTRAMYMQD